jgi:hypothetical protein
MIIVNYYQDEDYNPDTDGYNLHLAAVVNDVLDLTNDIDLITDCIENDSNFKPKNGVFYELHLDRANIRAPYPAIDPAFAITNIVEYNYNEVLGHHKPIVNL